jgi:hypothetical protein
MRADDALKYAAALLKDRTDWTLEQISYCDCGDDHETATEAIAAVVHDIRALAAVFGDPRRYSDGRPIETSSAEIIPTYGSRQSHIWHPDPSQEKPQRWRGPLLSDPGVPCPGIYEVSTDPATQDIHVRVMRSV